MEVDGMDSVEGLALQSAIMESASPITPSGGHSLVGRLQDETSSEGSVDLSLQLVPLSNIMVLFTVAKEKVDSCIARGGTCAFHSLEFLRSPTKNALTKSSCKEE